MSIKIKQDHPAKLSELNKKIVEIKKKIQLSEGQRKALFESCETERKFNSDEILKLKKEISTLVVSLHESREPTVKLRLENKKLESVIGPILGKSSDEIIELLDLQIIDKSKQLNLVRYKVQQRKKYLAELSINYQKLVSKKEKKQLTEKVENPIKKSISELQNSIHAAEVQIREANHIRNRYTDIKKSLEDDAAKFGCSIKKLEEELGNQNNDIDKLKNIMNEAMKMRSDARNKLLGEEKATMSSANMREKQAAEGRRLVNQRKQELERLEIRLFQSGKMPIRPEPEGAEDAGHANDEEKPDTPPHPVDTLIKAFETLKQATGGTSTEEVLERFGSQKDTQERLKLLRKKSENEKKQLEKTVEALTAQLEAYKYAEVKDAEKKTGEMERLQKLIENNIERSRQSNEDRERKFESTVSTLSGLQGLYLCINPMAIPEKDALILLQKIKDDLQRILQKVESNVINEKMEKIYVETSDEKWLPAPYNSLVRRTPLPQTGPTAVAPPLPPGSDDEEEVPSRSYLKRQAQLVVDAKSRRKNIRIQLPKRN